MTSLFQQPTFHSSVAIFKQHQRMRFKFHNSCVILRLVSSTLIFWTEFRCWGKRYSKEVTLVLSHEFNATNSHSELIIGAVVAVIVWQLDFQLPMQSVPITNDVVSSNLEHYVIKFVRDLRQVGSFLCVLRFPPSKKTDRPDITETLLKVALNSIKPNELMINRYEILISQ